MAGVAGPMLRRSKPQGARFLVGLFSGGVLASVLLASLVFGLGTLLEWLIPSEGRWWLAVAALLGFGLLDLTDRTPHIWRQVPQAFIRRLPPGRLGLVWGFDLSLLFTTQKSTSLAWATLAGLTLLLPGAAWLVLVVMTVVGVSTIAVRSVRFALVGLPEGVDRARPWRVHMRRLSGIGLVLLALVLAVQGW